MKRDELNKLFDEAFKELTSDTAMKWAKKGFELGLKTNNNFRVSIEEMMDDEKIEKWAFETYHELGDSRLYEPLIMVAKQLKTQLIDKLTDNETTI